MDEIDFRIVTQLRGGFPVTERPYCDAAAQFGLNEEELIKRLEKLLDEGVLTRFGPLYQVERLGGAYSLAAMQVPEADYKRIVKLVNEFPQVAHNYRRENAFNMWFVVAAASHAEVKRVLFSIEQDSTYPVFEFPKLCEYFVNHDLHAWRSSMTDPNAFDEFDRAIVLATQAGLPLVPRPWHAAARQVGRTPAQVMDRVEHMLELGIILRIGALPDYDAIGYRWNGMSVWDVDDSRVDALGQQLAESGLVSDCYLRTRHLPDWPYNLFAIVHGMDRSEVETKLRRIAMILGSAVRTHEVLHSSRTLKKTGLRLQKKHRSDASTQKHGQREHRNE
jgi:siroheme decarboxylase